MLSLDGSVTGVTSTSLAADESTLNDVSVSVLLTFAAESVTVTVQLSYDPSLKELITMRELPLITELLSEVQELEPPYVIVPASSEEKV